MKKFLVIQTASIGDVILATAVVEKLHAYFPDSQIDMMIKKGYESLFENHPYLNKVLTWNKKRHKYGSLISNLMKIRAERYDLIVNVQRYAATGFITAFGKAKETAGFDKNPFSRFFTHKVEHKIGVPGLHEVDRNQKLIEHITDAKAARPVLYPNDAVLEKVKHYKSERYICVAPCSLWFTKQFPEDRWVHFLRLVPDDLKVYLLGGMDDNETCDRIIAQVPNKHIESLAGHLNLLESAALMRDAAMNFVCDSSPMHLASSQNAPITAVFCSTVTDFGFGPLSDDSVVVEENRNLKCRPCGLHGYKECPKGHFNCANFIEIKELTDRL
ncbi:MAG: glycosyltransferase family 9 protein [Bacteroidales bacterium]|nr:glycosyltransferase family 9 protein [Bacteroidales bacterium]